MKILLFIDSLGSGGAQRQLVELAKGFKEKNYQVSFLTYHNLNFFKPELDDANISVKTIVEPNYLKRVFKIRKEIRNAKPDIVLSFLEASNFMATLSGFPYRKWKLIVGERSANPKILKSFKLRFFRLFHLFTDFVVANSYANINMVKKVNPFLSEKKCKVIYLVIDEEKWNANNISKSRSNEKFNLVVFASHQYLKNAKGLVEALNMLSFDYKNRIQVDWYGGTRNDNSYYEVVELVKEYDLEEVINFHPPTTQVKEIMTAADCVGLFSYYEGLPNAVCEAMMLGKPVIASRVSDIPLFLDHNMTFDPSNYKEIADTIAELVNADRDKFQQLGAQNQRQAKRLFAKNEILESYIDLFGKRGF